MLADFAADLRLQALSPATIHDRLGTIRRLQLWLQPGSLADATEHDLTRWQRGLRHLAPSSVDIYTRHVQAFYRWAHRHGHVPTDPSVGLIHPRVPRGRPHPMSVDDLRTVFACTTGTLRIVFLLAAFAGMRRGEICRLQRADIDLDGRVADVQGKGNKPRKVPLLGPVITELEPQLPRTGYVVTYRGNPYDLDLLSAHVRRHLDDLGINSTLHSCRHSFATQTYRSTRDLLMLAELLGHSSVATTQIYAEPDMSAAHVNLRPVADLATGILDPRRRTLRAAS